MGTRIRSAGFVATWLLLIFGTACDQARDATPRSVHAPLVSGPTDRPAPRGAGRAPLTLDDRFLEIGKQVPRFGGMFVADGDEILLIADRELPAPALASGASASHRPDPDVDPAWSRGAAAAMDAVLGPQRRSAMWRKQVHHVEFEFASLHQWRRQLEDTLATPWVYADVDERRNAVVFGIERPEADERHLRAAAAALGIPQRALVVEKTERIQKLATLRDAYRPIIGGLQTVMQHPTGVSTSCAIGFTAISDQTVGFVTASHCSLVAGVDGSVFYQGGARIGTEWIDPSFTLASQYVYCGYCPTGAYCRWSDATFVAYDSGVNVLGSAIARPGGYGSTTFAPNAVYRILQTVTYPLQGEYVHRVGPMSGLIRAQIISSCVDAGNQTANGTVYLNLCQEKARLTDPVGGRADQTGDSGAPVFIDLGGYPDARVAGITWGAANLTDFYISSLWNIEQDLGTLDGIHITY